MLEISFRKSQAPLGILLTGRSLPFASKTHFSGGVFPFSRVQNAKSPQKGKICYIRKIKLIDTVVSHALLGFNSPHISTPRTSLKITNGALGNQAICNLLSGDEKRLMTNNLEDKTEYYP